MKLTILENTPVKVELKESETTKVVLKENEPIKVSLSENTPTTVSLKENFSLIVPITVKEVSSMGERLPDYEGEYVVTPKVVEQILNTKNTSMLDDVTVKEIPYQEVSNLKGLTVTIGGI